MDRIPLQDRRDRLAQLAPRVGPVAFARDRVLPVAPALQPLLPEGGLVRGSVVGCLGTTAVSVALALVAETSASGSWLAVVGLPTLGLRAASEVGIALERLVMIAEPTDPELKDPDEASWANLVSALVDGFDLVLLRSSPRLRAGTARRLQARLQARGGVLVVVGDPGQFGCDLTISCPEGMWEGLGAGSGRLVRRRLALTARGRRIPRPRQTELWLPGAQGGIETIHATHHETIHENRRLQHVAAVVAIPAKADVKTLEKTG